MVVLVVVLVIVVVVVVVVVVWLSVPAGMALCVCGSVGNEE